MNLKFSNILSFDPLEGPESNMEGDHFFRMGELFEEFLRKVKWRGGCSYGSEFFCINTLIVFFFFFRVGYIRRKGKGTVWFEKLENSSSVETQDSTCLRRTHDFHGSSVNRERSSILKNFSRTNERFKYFLTLERKKKYFYIGYLLFCSFHIGYNYSR